jgi:hypothetical protein
LFVWESDVEGEGLVEVAEGWEGTFVVVADGEAAFEVELLVLEFWK